MTIEQVAAIDGKFYTSGGHCVQPDNPHASWFVPRDSSKPVLMLLRDGTWGERGF